MNVRKWTGDKALAINEWAGTSKPRRRAILVVATPLFVLLTLAEALAAGVSEWKQQWRDVWPDLKDYWRGVP